ncbi:MAG: hypothetical protein K2L91_10345 [Duncaniella sp.]|nr:hypothetical protein [Duncaniella sp.]
MSSTLKIYCKNLKEYIALEGGESLVEVAAALGDRLGFEPVCALVNNKVEGLVHPAFAKRRSKPCGRDAFYLRI